MKVIFLDIDGVLNSCQEAVWHNRIWKKRYFARAIQWLWYQVYTPTRKLVEKFEGKRHWSWSMTLFSLYFFSDHCDFCPIACSNLRYLMDENPDVMLVISSTWRGHGMFYCRSVLRRNGIDPKRVIDRTPSGRGKTEDGFDPLPDQGGRGLQIQEWLFNNAHLKVEKFVILDDDSDMCHLKKYLVKTDNLDGLTWTKMVDAAEMLEAKVA